ncbi:MAG: transposase [Gloeocapsa sp. DLM2.Bin57]|nr:MAG: transposase [Gloeocapsa sp. DLM2.Bin57]
MPNYRRLYVSGGTYFITQVTYHRQKWLCSEIGRKGLREAIEKVREKYPFSIDAFVLLPDHFHGLWTLPEHDKNISVRLRLIKTYVTKHYRDQLGIDLGVSLSRQKRGESNLWQRRFWEHCIRDERDFALHSDYIHYNPVNHGLCDSPQDWSYSSLHRLILEGVYPPDWGRNEHIIIPDNIGQE